MPATGQRQRGMSWQQYDLVFHLLSPLHIGARKVSNLQQTRGYVTGKVFWAALTAHITRETISQPYGEDYRNIGQDVQEYFRFSYLYPALRVDGEYQVHYPWQDDFDYLFLNSYASTALNYDSFSAEDAMLHETEFIAPVTRTREPVYLQGSIFVREGLPAELHAWPDVLNRLQFGGERGYGWGRVALSHKSNGQAISGEPLGEAVKGKDGCWRITAHLKTEGATGISGPVEPLIGWERAGDNETTWRLSKKAVITYAPGAQVQSPETFQIVAHGLWR